MNKYCLHRMMLPLVVLALRDLGAAELHVPGDYATIQAAINVASAGDTIQIAAGDYFEQLIITNKAGLTLAAAPGAVLHVTAEMYQTLLPYGSESFSLLGIVMSDVVVTGLTFDGENMADLYRIFTGIDFLASSGRVKDCTVRRFRRAALAGFSTFDLRGISIWNGVSLGAAAVNVGVFNCTFEENQTSVVIAGDDEFNPTMLRTTFALHGNTVNGFGPIDMAVDGVVIFNGAGGEISHNTIKNHLYTGNAREVFSGGIAAWDGRWRPSWVPLQAVHYMGNTFSNNTVHLVILTANESQVINNIFHAPGPGYFPWSLGMSGTNILVANNDFSDMPTGIALFGGETYRDGGSTTNPKLVSNWFCNVPEPIRTEPLVTGVEEQGTELCETGPFRPTIQSIRSLDGGGAALRLRSWHGERMIIEASFNLLQWTPVHTNMMTIPSFEYQDSKANGLPHLFYRGVRP